MTIHLRFFAAASDFGQDGPMDVPAGSTVADVAATLRTRWPDAIPLLDRVAYAVNAKYASGDVVLRDRDEVAIMPPVSGG